jgi:hypothetical protein
MKYHFRDLLTLLISLFILSGCSNPSLVGLDVDPGDQIQGLYIDTVSIQTATFREDSLITSGLPNTSLGYLQDPVIGKSSASFAFAVAPLAAGDSRLPAGITIDSAVLIVNYGNDFFGDSTASTYQIDVNQLREPYIFGKSYYSNQQWNIEPELMGGRIVHKFSYKDSVSISKNVDGKDSIIRVAPQLRIPLNGSKIKNLFDSNQDSAYFAKAENFHSLVKGFYVSINQNAQSGTGGIVQLTIDNEQNGIEVYYKLPDSTSQSVRRYAISSNQTSTAITHVYSTEVKNALTSTDKDQSTIFVEGLAGLGASIRFPNLENLKNQDIIINKAELVMYVDSDVTGSTFTEQAPRLTLYRKDIAGQNMPIPDGDTRTSPDGYSYADPRSFGIAYGGFYDKDKKRYLFTLTSFVQDILLGKAKNNSIYLTPASPRELNNVPYSPSTRAPSRAILGGGNSEKYKMKLNIYYSKVND